MYYEEKPINGIWMWRNSPNGEWVPLDSQRLHSKINDLENKLGAVQNHLENCHEAFKARKHGGVAEQTLRHGIEDIFRMPYDG